MQHAVWVPKSELGLQNATAWVETILGVRNFTRCHAPFSKQGANNITVHNATDSQHAMIVGVPKGTLLIQRAQLS